MKTTNMLKSVSSTLSIQKIGSAALGAMEEVQSYKAKSI